MLAGFSGGDVLVALGGLKVTRANLATLLGRYKAGDLVSVHAFRRDEFLSRTVKLQSGDLTYKISQTRTPVPHPDLPRA
jgi:predicted metalloprotease with PDZ domain